MRTTKVFQATQPMDGASTFEILNAAPNKSGANGIKFYGTIEISDIKDKITLEIGDAEKLNVDANGVYTFEFNTKNPAQEPFINIKVAGTAVVTTKLETER